MGCACVFVIKYLIETMNTSSSVLSLSFLMPTIKPS